jgi:hypothetical protein
LLYAKGEGYKAQSSETHKQLQFVLWNCVWFIFSLSFYPSLPLESSQPLSALGVTLLFAFCPNVTFELLELLLRISVQISARSPEVMIEFFVGFLSPSWQMSRPLPSTFFRTYFSFMRLSFDAIGI